ncbi:PGF-pre-PGF domain-containing protein [Candidatus Woesearchaeota archaeon]|nr:PGF-pre-PGF domain-containing protein [Candidatus Woesearchaeota archaeon]
MRTIDYFVLFIFIISSFDSVSAVSINQGVILNTTSSNSSVTFSFNINASNFTVESSYILLNGINFTNSTGTYTCDDVNHSTTNSNLDSSQFTCTLQSSVSDPPNSSSGGGSSSYIRPRSSTDSLKADVRISSGKTASLSFIDDGGTGIQNLQIKAKSYISGYLEIHKISKKPIHCILPKFDDEYKIYKIIEINHTFENDKIDEIYLDFFVEKDWIERNQIYKITTYRCHPTTESLKTEVIDYEKFTYRVYSDGFSIWVIGGLKEKQKEEIEVANQTDNNEEIIIAEEFNTSENAPIESFIDKDAERDSISGAAVFKGEEKNFLEKKAWIYMVFVILFLLVLFSLLFFKKRKQRKKHKKR